MTHNIPHGRDEDYPVLYVLMRNDVPDYQPGKAMAQANHAGTAFMRRMIGLHGPRMDAPMLAQWLQEANGFGTCVVLGVDHRTLLTKIDLAGRLGFDAGVVVDPTYPIRDGHQMQALEVTTCGWVFAMKEEAGGLLGDLRLF